MELYFSYMLLIAINNSKTGERFRIAKADVPSRTTATHISAVGASTWPALSSDDLQQKVLERP